MRTLIYERVELAQQGRNPTAVCKLPSGWVVLGDRQVTEGYCILLSDPVVPSLNALDEAGRRQFLSDMARLGDALLTVTGAARINYEILGNTDAALHAHVFPRYDSEVEERRRMPVWFYDFSAARPFDAQRDQALMAALRAELEKDSSAQ